MLVLNECFYLFYEHVTNVIDELDTECMMEVSQVGVVASMAISAAGGAVGGSARHPQPVELNRWCI